MKRERELQAWQPDSSVPDPASALNLSLNGTQRDELTFGANSGTGGAWDQFATNEKLFGVTTSFNEDEYTTKLDRSAKDYKEKEKRAEKIAAEITGVSAVFRVTLFFFVVHPPSRPRSQTLTWPKNATRMWMILGLTRKTSMCSLSKLSGVFR